MVIRRSARNARAGLPAPWGGKREVEPAAARALAAVLLPAAALGWNAGPLSAAEVACVADRPATTARHVQIVFDTVGRRCAISDVGPVPDNAIRVFLVPGFSTPAALGQKIENADALPPDSFVTDWTDAVASDDAHTRGFASRQPGTFTATLVGEMNGGTYTMKVTFTLAGDRTITVDAARVSLGADDQALVTGSLATPGTDISFHE